MVRGGTATGEKPKAEADDTAAAEITAAHAAEWNRILTEIG